MKYLSQALNVPLTADGRLSPLDDEKYVLTLDYTLKMLNVHERREGGIPAIIQGETGVGKTALIKMLSQLWNLSLRVRWNRQCGHILDQIIIKVEGIPKYCAFIMHTFTREGVCQLCRCVTNLLILSLFSKL